MLIYAAQLLRDKCLSQGLLKLPEGRKTTPSKFPVPTIESDVSRGSQTKTTVG